MDHYRISMKKSFIKKPKTKKNWKEIKIQYRLRMNRYDDRFTIRLGAVESYRKKGQEWKFHGIATRDLGGPYTIDHGRDFDIYSEEGILDESNSWTIDRKIFISLLDKFEKKLISMCAHYHIKLTDREKEKIRYNFLNEVRKKDPFIKLI